ncbi:hypothetical protein [Halalkalibacter okhensis]|uniref:Pilus assembly protein PilO n=1 Tax=Halalkalibacter okhensis TaxID=333138 RepID=A0A0B0II40_9BACI|nr:hypothetical protein [Halalkalibacter okhensis]KHF40945.1 hypothetical protein LQ50_06030 [Halalkalibacter okhensis]
MRIEWTRKHIYIATGSVVALLVCFFFIVTSFIFPTQLERDQAEETLLVEQQILSELQTQAEERPETTQPLSSQQLLKKLPVTSLVDQMLLAFSQAEGISNTYISLIEVDENGRSVLVEGDPSNEQESNNSIELVSGSNDEEVEAVSLPVNIDGLQSVRFTLEIHADDYEGLALFIEEIDRMERLLNIDSISFIGPDEQVYVDESARPFDFRLVISAFYFPEASEELQQEQTLIDYPNPAGKRSPLYNE